MGRPRCRTSFLSMAYRDYYGLEYLHETFFESVKPLWIKANALRTKDNLNKLQQSHIQSLKNITKKIFLSDGAIIKFFPRDVMTHCYVNLKFTDIQNFNYKCITNLSEVFQLEKYNQILLLERNFLDSAMSFIYGHVMGIMLFERNVSKTFYEKKITPVTITEQHLQLLNFYILEYLVDQNIKKFVRTRYSCKTLDYNIIPNFVEENFNNSKTNYYVDLELDYKNLIVNYQEIVEYINLKLEEYSNNYKSVTFT